MTEFRDYSTYLQKLVYMERKTHDMCNERQYQAAKRYAMEMQRISGELVMWLDERVHGAEECKS
jgi:hypothetical protein